MVSVMLTSRAARIHVLHTRDHVIHKRDVRGHVINERMPHEMALRVDIDRDQSVNLKLTRNDHVISMVPVIVGEKGTVKQWQSSSQEVSRAYIKTCIYNYQICNYQLCQQLKYMLLFQNFAVYTDKEKNAAMFVKSSHAGAGQTKHEFVSQG